MRFDGLLAVTDWRGRSRPQPGGMERATGFDAERSEALALEFSRRLKSETKPRHPGSGPRCGTVDAGTRNGLICPRYFAQSGRSSVGRVRASQARCRGFEPRRPLQHIQHVLPRGQLLRTSTCTHFLPAPVIASRRTVVGRRSDLRGLERRSRRLLRFRREEAGLQACANRRPSR